MKNFNLKSYLVGLGTGLVILVVFIFAKPYVSPETQTQFPRGGQFDSQQRGQFQGQQGGQGGQFPPEGMQPQGGMMNEERLQSMAEQFGMTVEELQAEMDAGKTLPEIAEEHGVELQFPGGMQGDRPPSTGTGASQAPTPTAEPSDTESVN